MNNTYHNLIDGNGSALVLAPFFPCLGPEEVECRSLGLSLVWKVRWAIHCPCQAVR